MDGSMYTEKNKQLNSRSQVYELVLTGIMAALVMAATSFFKIPVPATNGYIHLGDALVFISVLVLGRRNGTIAAASGSALADLLGGYAHWVPWTFVIKGLMAFVTGTILFSGKQSRTCDADNKTREAKNKTREAENTTREVENTTREAVAYIAGGLVMIAGYFIAHIVIYGTIVAPLAALPGNLIQAGAGIVIAEVVSVPLSRSGVLKQ